MTPLSIERLDELESKTEALCDIALAQIRPKELLTLIDMARSAVWRTDMENAPRDGTQVDIWIVPPSKLEKNGPFKNSYATEEFPSGYRIPNAIGANCGANAWVDGESNYATGRWYYDDKGDECLDPDDTSDFAFRAAAWRLPPSPPEPSS